MRKSVAKAIKAYIVKEMKRENKIGINLKATYRRAKKNFLTVPRDRRNEILINL